MSDSGVEHDGCFQCRMKYLNHVIYYQYVVLEYYFLLIFVGNLKCLRN